MIRHSLGLLISLLTCGSVWLSWGASSSIQCRVWHLRSSKHTKIAQWILSIFRRRPRSDFVTRAIVFCASKAIISISITNKWILNAKPPLGLRENDSRYLETIPQRWRTGRWRSGKFKRAIYRSRGEPHTIFEPDESGTVFIKSLAEVGIYWAQCAHALMSNLAWDKIKRRKKKAAKISWSAHLILLHPKSSYQVDFETGSK